MRLLPALAAGPKRSLLPLCDRTAECLGGAMLANQGSALREALLRQMQLDPPLLVWLICHAWMRSGLRPSSLPELADWFTEHMVDVLQWGDEEKTHVEVHAAQAERYADQVTHDLQVADLAAQMAIAQGNPLSDQALFFGLLADVRRWLALTAADGAEPPLECLPAWLDEDSPAVRLARRAASIIDGNTAPEPGLDLEASRRRAEQGRSQWLQAGSPLAAQLPSLTAKLARLAQLERSFQESVEVEKLEAMAEFAAGLGHEINNPLAIIAGRAQLLMTGETDAERRRELAVVNAQVKRAHEMIADMRLFARPPRPEPKRFDLIAMVDAIVEDLVSQGAERSITARRTGDEGPLEIEADPAQLEVALRAMGKNSLELIAHGGQIQIDVAAAADLVRISVADNGPGLLPEHRRHLFDPFYSARQAGRGLGLGLSKCWRIVTSHGGRIEVESQPGQGAKFVVWLPRWQGSEKGLGIRD
jgi:signal transduction histidine kinase